MKLHITAVKHFKENKENQPLLDKNSRPYTRITIQTQEHGKTWLSGLGYQGDAQLNWKASDEVEADVTQNGQYTNFSIPKTGGGRNGAAELMNPNGQIIEKLFTNIKRIEDKIDRLLDNRIAEQVPSLDEIRPEDIPF